MGCVAAAANPILNSPKKDGPDSVPSAPCEFARRAIRTALIGARIPRSAAEISGMPLLPGDSSLPDWAVAQANAALKIGVSVPEIEQGLVAQGLAPSTASAVVNAVLEGRLRANASSLGSGEGAL